MIESISKQVDMKMNHVATTKLGFIFKEIILSLGIIGIFVPIIVDISISRKLTWSLIVGISILYFFSGLVTFSLSKKNKCIKSFGVYSILLIPYLFGLETIIDYLYLDPSQNRFFEYALPISIVWLVIVWSVILLGVITKLNKCYLISILFLLAIVGTSITNMIARKIPWIETFYDFEQMIQIIEYIGGAIFFFFLGTFRKINKKVLTIK